MAYSPHALLIVFRGRGHIILIFYRFTFIVLDTRPFALVIWPSFVIILRIVSGKFELCTRHCEKQNTEAGLKGAHMINKAVLLKWNVAMEVGGGTWEVVGV